MYQNNGEKGIYTKVEQFRETHYDVIKGTPLSTQVVYHRMVEYTYQYTMNGAPHGVPTGTPSGRPSDGTPDGIPEGIPNGIPSQNQTIFTMLNN